MTTETHQIDHELDYAADECDFETNPTDGQEPDRRHLRPLALGSIFVVTTVLVLGGLAGWLGYRYQRSQAVDQQRAEFLQAARQGAVNLTTIDWRNADTDVQRILDSATGTFYDEFVARSDAFAAVVKQAKSISEGTVSLAGLESTDGNTAVALVAARVRTRAEGQSDSAPRDWRMRIEVQDLGADVKVSKVEFVP